MRQVTRDVIRCLEVGAIYRVRDFEPLALPLAYRMRASAPWWLLIPVAVLAAAVGSLAL